MFLGLKGGWLPTIYNWGPPIFHFTCQLISEDWHFLFVGPRCAVEKIAAVKAIYFDRSENTPADKYRLQLVEVNQSQKYSPENQACLYCFPKFSLLLPLTEISHLQSIYCDVCRPARSCWQTFPPGNAWLSGKPGCSGGKTGHFPLKRNLKSDRSIYCELCAAMQATIQIVS